MDELRDRIRRQRLLLLSSSSSNLRAFSSPPPSTTREEAFENKAKLEEWRREKQARKDALEKREREKRALEEQRVREEERKGRAERLKRNQRREAQKREHVLETLIEKEKSALLPKQKHSAFEILARRQRDVEIAKNQFNAATRRERERREREDRLARAAAKLKPRIFGSSVLHAHTKQSAERSRALNKNERAKINAERWFLPPSSVIP